MFGCVLIIVQKVIGLYNNKLLIAYMYFVHVKCFTQKSSKLNSQDSAGD